MAAGWINDPAYERQLVEISQRRVAEIARIRSTLTPEQVAASIQIAGEFGNVLDPGVAMSVAQMNAALPGDTRPDIRDDPMLQAAVAASTDEKLSGGFFGTLGRGVKSFVRGGFAGMEGLAQEANYAAHGIWQAIGDPNVSLAEGWKNNVTNRDTYLSEAIGAMRGRNEFDLGDGIIPAGRTTDLIDAQGGDFRDTKQRYLDPTHDDYDPRYYQQLEQLYTEAPRLRGQPISTGRFAMNMASDLPGIGTYYEPGTKAYAFYSGLIDTTWRLFTDPVNVGSKVTKPYKVYRQSMGLIDNRLGRAGRQTVDADKAVENYLSSAHGSALVDKVLETTSIEQMYTLLSNKGKNSSIPTHVLRTLTETTGTDTAAMNGVREVLADQIYEGRLRQRVNIGKENRLNYTIPVFNRSLRDVRLFNDMPGEAIALQNLDEGFGTVRSYLINAKIAPEARDTILTKYAKAHTLDDIEEVLVDIASEIDFQTEAITGRKLDLVKNYQMGFGKIRANLADQIHREMASPHFDDIGNPIYLGGDEPEVVARATLLAEMTDAVIPMLDRREIRAAVEATTGLLDRLGPMAWNNPGSKSALSQGVNIGRGILEASMQIWKPAQLIRGAWTIRVLGEQQLRLAALGINNQINSPLTAIAAKLGMKNAEFGVSAKGDYMEGWTEFRQAMTRRNGGWIDNPDRRFMLGDMRQYLPGDDDYVNVLADQIHVMQSDELARNAARALLEPDYAVNQTRRKVEEIGRVRPNRGMTDVLDDLDDATALPEVPTPGLPTSRAEFASLDDTARNALIDSVVSHIDAVRAPSRHVRDRANTGRSAYMRNDSRLEKADADELIDIVNGLRDAPPTTRNWSQLEDVLAELTDGTFLSGKNLRSETAFARSKSVGTRLAAALPEVPAARLRGLSEAIEQYGPIADDIEYTDLLRHLQTEGRADATVAVLNLMRHPRDASGKFRKATSKEDFARFKQIWNDAYDEAVDGTGALSHPTFTDAAPYSKGPLADAWEGGIPLTKTSEELVPVTGLDALNHSFWDGDLANIRRLLANDRSRQAVYETNTKGGTIDPMMEVLSDRQTADRYIRGVVDKVQELTELTGGDTDLLEAIAYGKLPTGRTLPNGTKLTVGYQEGAKNPKYMRALKKKVDEHQASLAPGETGRMLFGPDFMHRQSTPAEMYKDVVNGMFDVLMTRPDNAFFRSPIYKQRYWENVGQLADRLDANALATVRKNAAKANLPKSIQKQLDAASGAGRLDINDIDQVSRIVGLDAVRNTLYDLTRRSQFAESMDLISPFIEAWREVLGFWSKQLIQNPDQIRKAQLAIEGARDTKLGPQNENWFGEKGFFHTNERGEEVFAYPGGDLIAKLTGLSEAPTLQANVSGLNLVASSVLPGVGPVVQWPVTMNPNGIVEDFANSLSPATQSFFGKNGYDALRGWTSPYGGPDGPEDLIGAFQPSWLRQLGTGLSPEMFDSRGYENLVGQVMRANVANGSFTRAEIDENKQAAETIARRMYIIRGIANSFTPTNFRPKLNIKDINGELHELEALAVDYRATIEKHDGDQEAAVVEFVGKYGLEPFLLTQGRSRQTTPRTTFDVGGVQWERANLELAETYEATFGLFAPLSGEPADFNSYLDAVRDGDILELDADQQIRLANNTLGYRQYMNAKDQVIARYGDTDEVRALLAEYRARLREELPGFDTYIPGVPGSPTIDEQLRELEFALTDDRLDSPAKTILAQYWDAREHMNELLAEKGITLKAPKGAVVHRQILADYGAQLAAENPDFQALWGRILSREVA